MKDMPNPFWAGLFIVLAVVLAIVALRVPTQPNVTMAVIAIASNIVSGSFGYISGHRDGATSVPTPTQPSPAATANPTTPADPA